MKIFILIFVSIVLTVAVPKKNNFKNLYKNPIKVSPKIAGGQQAEPHSIPYQAYIEVYGRDEVWYCGGTLISENYVLTSGYCATIGGRTAYVLLGAHQLYTSEDTQVEFESQNITVHPDYDFGQLFNDIAVIRLPSAAPLGDAIQIAKLPSKSDVHNDFTGAIARASGWGINTYSPNATISEVLKYVDLEVISNEECMEDFGSLPDTVLCTSGVGNVGVCGGDTGGPLVSDGILIGVTSFGGQNCDEEYPSGFTRVTSFLDWLESNTDVVLE